MTVLMKKLAMVIPIVPPGIGGASTTSNARVTGKRQIAAFTAAGHEVLAPSPAGVCAVQASHRVPTSNH
jgi:hypothetical protein